MSIGLSFKMDSYSYINEIITCDSKKGALLFGSLP